MISALFPLSATTGAVTVRASVSFQAETSEPSGHRWFWVYHIRIENDGDAPVQLIDRRWEITDGRGAISYVEGPGVVGEQPVIQPGASFDYVSGCPLATPTGRMVGEFGMMDGTGGRFSVMVPELPLFAPAVSQ
jgi:ApaG protein